MCGALTTRSPAAVKTAQLKSSRSLTFTLLDVLRSVIPICSAMAAKRLLKTSSVAGSHGTAAFPAVAIVSLPALSSHVCGVVDGRESKSSPRDNTSPRQPGSITVVAVASCTTAGPAITSPGSNPARSKTPVAIGRAAKCTRIVRSGLAGREDTRVDTGSGPTVCPTTSTRAATISTVRPSLR